MSDEVIVCEAKDCERPVDYAKLAICVGHYRRLERLVGTWMLANPDSEMKKSTYKRLLTKVKASGPMRRRLVNPVICAETECQRFAEKRTYCNVHYNKHLAWNDLPPDVIAP